MKPFAQKISHPEWSKNAVIYEVNIRQYTKEGTFEAFSGHLPRLEKMGVSILWIMPVHPIGKTNRKGTLGSAYSVADYFSVHPDYGKIDDFKKLVRKAHDSGMHVIIDWVANHTAWDNPWVKTHPQWYRKNEKGELHDYTYDNGKELEYWTDVTGLDYSNKELWDEMISALKFWVKETDIDGFRCDVASLVPTAFWERARKELEQIKPVFMLAESFDPQLHRLAFDMTYDWDFHDAMKLVACGKDNADIFRRHIEDTKLNYPPDAYRMLFTSNHDKNAWDGSDTEKFGNSLKAFFFLTFMMPGMPLIYGGQESVLDKRISFFEKDPIEWKTLELEDFLAKLIKIKKENRCLWNGEHGGRIKFFSSEDKLSLIFSRGCGDEEIFALINFSGHDKRISVAEIHSDFQLEAWGFKLFSADGKHLM